MRWSKYAPHRLIVGACAFICLPRYLPPGDRWPLSYPFSSFFNISNQCQYCMASSRLEDIHRNVAKRKMVTRKCAMRQLKIMIKKTVLMKTADDSFSIKLENNTSTSVYYYYYNQINVMVFCSAHLDLYQSTPTCRTTRHYNFDIIMI